MRRMCEKCVAHRLLRVAPGWAGRLGSTGDTLKEMEIPMDELITVPSTLTEWALKLRRYHRCGGEIWITNQQQSTFYQEVGYSDYVAVAECPHCQVELTPASVGENR